MNPILVPCKYCKVPIHPDSGKCPACGGNQPIFWNPHTSKPADKVVGKAILVIVAVLIGIILLARQLL